MTVRQTVFSAILAFGLIITLGAAPKEKHAKDYQVTGPVLDVEDNLVTVQKDDEKWQIEVPAGTKVKVGDKVTIYYHMIATKVEHKKESKK